MRIFGIILAGGQSRRMGTDKALATLAGHSLLSHVLARFEPQVEALALSANGDPARFAAFNLPVLPDTGLPDTGLSDTGLSDAGLPDAASHGPLSGILAALLWAAPLGATAVVSVPVDGPFLPPDLVPRLCLAAGPDGPALAASPNGLHPTFGLWPVSLAPALAAFLASGAKARVRDFAAAHGAGTAHFPDDLAFANANTAEDLARFAQIVTRP